MSSPEAPEESVKGHVVTMSQEKTNQNGNLYGTSKYLQPVENSALVAQAEFEDFAPAACVCCGPCVNDKIRQRTYVRVYENRLEYNYPVAPFCCLSKNRCIKDMTRVYYFDQQPTRIGMACGFIPITCCGAPVIFNKVPKLLGCIDLRPCFGETIFASPCECWNLKMCCGCCGAPCYQTCACPMFPAVKNGEEFLGQWKHALTTYWSKNNLKPQEMAKFCKNVDKFCNCDSAREIAAIAPMER